MQEQNIRYLFRLYQTNQISEKELEQLFELLNKAEHDEELKQLLDEIWDVTVPEPVIKRHKLWLKIAAIALLLIIPIYFALRKTEKKEIVINNPQGHAPIKVLLEDSTTVWLNTASSLHYKETREITLQGEAFFDVAHNAAKPFVVHSGSINTQVLGTSFNIKAYGDDPRIAVTVISGKVSVDGNYLEKGQQIIYTNGSYHKNEIEAASETAWKNDDMIFLSTPVPEAVHILERRFNVKISINKKLNKCLFFGDFNQEPLESILKMLAATVNGKLIKEDSGYRIEGDGCY